MTEAKRGESYGSLLSLSLRKRSIRYTFKTNEMYLQATPGGGEKRGMASEESKA